MDHEPRPASAKPGDSNAPSESPLREYASSELLHGAKEILIRHGDDVYRLRLTRNDKLILQK